MYSFCMSGFRIVKKDSFPENLINSNAELPGRLWIKGKVLKRDNMAVAIVGSRRMSGYGKKQAYRFAYDLAKKGVTIVSGMARGVDSVAHKAALRAGGRTIAVMASGIDVVYPPENTRLYERIIKNGAVITEFEPGSRPLPHHFLYRNRLIAAMSKVVLVVEGGRRSGTLSTANHAASLGVDVFAVPGPVDSFLSELPNYLIENGAGVASNYKDILDSMR